MIGVETLTAADKMNLMGSKPQGLDLEVILSLKNQDRAK